MKRALLTDEQVDALIVTAHAAMDGRLELAEGACLEDAVRALKDAVDVPDGVIAVGVRAA